MGNIVNDIVEDINIKPNKSKLIIKWVISIAGSLIVLAFIFGQFKSSFFNRMDNFEETLNKSTTAVEQLKTDMNAGFENVNIKIDKIYSDGLIIFNGFQEYNNAQLGLIVDYGNGNKDMLKRMLEISAMKQQQDVETQIETTKNESVITEKPEFSIAVKPFNPKDYIGMVHFIEVESNDTIFHLTGATEDFINKIDRKKYEVGAITENSTHPGLYDLSYRNK